VNLRKSPPLLYSRVTSGVFMVAVACRDGGFRREYELELGDDGGGRCLNHIERSFIGNITSEEVDVLKLGT